MIGPVSRIMEEVARKHGLTMDDLKKRTTSPRYAWPRQEVMYRCVTETKAPYRAIAAALGLKDHKSVVVGVPLHAERLVWLARMTAVPAVNQDIHSQGYFTQSLKRAS